MEESRTRLTMPALARAVGVTRSRAERLVMQYADRLGAVERAGIVRTWSADAVDTLRVVLDEERALLLSHPNNRGRCPDCGVAGERKGHQTCLCKRT